MNQEEKLVTNKELAMWLAKGNGEICISGINFSYHNYENDYGLVTDILVRKWGDEGWYKPTRQYLGLSKHQEKLATNRQIAEWLARGKGQICFYKDDILSNTKLSYFSYEDDNEPATEILASKWDDENWHLPTLEYLGLEDNNF